MVAPSSNPQLSVVIACGDSCATLGESLRRLEAQTSEVDCQVLLVVRDDECLTNEVRGMLPERSILRGDRKDLVPHLWGLGLKEAVAPLVTLTIGSCLPHPDWIATQVRLAAEHPDVAGFGGPILPPPGGSARDWAAYWVRYSTYLPLLQGEAREIPGDNAVYRKEDLDRDWTDRESGFWEVLFHRGLRDRGRHLWFDHQMRVTLGPGTAESAFMGARFRHGRHFGSTRELPNALWRIPAALSAPVLIPMLLWRIRGRMKSWRPEWSSRFNLALAWNLAYLSSWSLGEVSGYLWPERE